MDYFLNIGANIAVQNNRLNRNAYISNDNIATRVVKNESTNTNTT